MNYLDATKTPLTAAAACLAIHFARLAWPQIPLSLALPTAAFFLSIRYGNGLASNLLTASIITAYAQYASMDMLRTAQVAFLSFGIALSMDYLKSKLAEKTEAATRAKIQIERLESEREIVDGIFVEVSETVQKILSMQRLARQRIMKFANDKNFQDDPDLFYAVEKIGDAMTLELGYTSIDEAVKRVKAEYKDK